MLRRTWRLALVIGTAAIGSLPAAVRADMIAPPPVTIPATDTNFGPGTAPNDPMIFNQFNPSLGTLTAVTVGVTYDFTHSGSVTFFTPGTITASATQDNLAVTLPGGMNIATANPPDYTQTVTFNPATMTLGTPVALPSVTNSGAIGPVSLTTPSELALFTGAGTIGLPVTAMAVATSNTNTGNGAATITTMAGATVTISYTYTPVPEPSSFVLLGLGGCGMLWVRRRRAA